MIDVYILHNNTDHSKALVEDCRSSLNSLGNIKQFNLIPVLGYRAEDAIALYKRLGYKIIPHYLSLLEANLTKEYRRELNGALCATAGHVKIWRKIAKSNKPSIVLEHDVVFKSLDFDLSELEDFMVYWLGPRTSKLEDYKFPHGSQVKLSEVTRFEGVHAYAITPKTAKYLLCRWAEEGFTDSIDGALAMRNWYNLTMVVLDPPPVVAVVDRDGKSQSSIEEIPATWNSENYPGFLSGLNCEQPPIRKVTFDNEVFRNSFPVIVLNKPKILAITNDDGTAIKILGNYLLNHEDTSELNYICPKEKLDENKFKSYFSNFYYKIHNVGMTNGLYNLVNVFLPAIKIHDYSMIYMDCYHLDHIDVLYNCLKLLTRAHRILILFHEDQKQFVNLLQNYDLKIQVSRNLAYITK